MRLPKREYPVRPYHFLVDRCVAKAGALLPVSANRVRYLKDVGLSENASDSAIVEQAALDQLIIVTANRRDFLNEIETFQKKQMLDCHDLYGLLILPNLHANQVRCLSKLNGKMRFERSSITWRHVQINDLSIRLTDDGEVRVTPLARSRYCLEFDPRRPMKND